VHRIDEDWCVAGARACSVRVPLAQRNDPLSFPALRTGQL